MNKQLMVHAMLSEGLTESTVACILIKYEEQVQLHRIANSVWKVIAEATADEAYNPFEAVVKSGPIRVRAAT